MTGKKPSALKSVWPLWFRALGSVWCAAFLLGTFAIVLIASTTIESKLGTPRAQRWIYQTHWFDAFLALMGLNITVSTVLRWPFKRKHTGFVVTHIGILALLIGSLITRLAGVEGQMLLYEGEHSDRIAASSYEVLVGRSPSAFDAVPLEKMRANRPFAALPDGTQLIYRGFRENAALETSVEDGGPAANPAIRVKLSSEMAGFNESFWLITSNPADPSSSTRKLGPATFEIRSGEPPATEPEKASEADSKPRLVFHKGGEVFATVLIDPLPSEPVAVGQTGYMLQKIQYWPDARVGEDNKLVSISNEPNNPAVEAELIAPDGAIFRLVRFTHFPDFESMHSKTAQKKPDFEFELKAGSGAPRNKPNSPILAFYSGKNWRFLFLSTKGGRSEGVIEEGKTYSAGWMDFQFLVERLVSHAQIRRSVKDVPGKGGGPAVRIRLEKAGRTIGEDWLTADGPITGPDGSLLPLRLRQRMVDVPFRLLLKDFRKVDYPGTTRAASFESDVTLEAVHEGFSLTKTIKMNKPLDYAGYRIFQSSFIEDDGHGEASVFTVAKNPGIPLIYGGSIVLFLGVFITFFVPPLSSLPAFKN